MRAFIESSIELRSRRTTASTRVCEKATQPCALLCDLIPSERNLWNAACQFGEYRLTNDVAVLEGPQSVHEIRRCHVLAASDRREDALHVGKLAGFRWPD